jgi:hypothetical protein
MIRKSHRIVGSIVALTLVLLLAYVLTYGWAEYMPLSQQNSWYHGLFYLVVIAVLLVAPYLVLKLVFHVAHLSDRHEKEISLKDISKDMDQLDASRR